MKIVRIMKFLAQAKQGDNTIAIKFISRVKVILDIRILYSVKLTKKVISYLDVVKDDYTIFSLRTRV